MVTICADEWWLLLTGGAVDDGDAGAGHRPLSQWILAYLHFLVGNTHVGLDLIIYQSSASTTNSNQ